MAKNKIQWGEQRGLELTHKFMEHFTHGLIKASVQLAKEFGSCLKRNKYHDGIMPFDNAAKYDENHILLKGNDELSKKAKDFPLLKIEALEFSKFNSKLSEVDGSIRE